MSSVVARSARQPLWTGGVAWSLVCFVVVLSGCAPVAHHRLDEAVSEVAAPQQGEGRDWIPVSTALKLGSAPASESGASSSGWQVTHRPDFNLRVEVPTDWSARHHVDVQTRIKAWTLAFGPRQGVHHGMLIFARRPRSEVDDYVREVPGALDLQRAYRLDEGQASLGGLPARFVEYAGTLGQTRERYHVMALVLDMGPEQWPVTMTMLVSGAHYSAYAPQIVRMLRTVTSLDAPTLAQGGQGGSSLTGWPSLGEPPSGSAAGDGARDAAVIVGVEDYLMVPDVQGARLNAEGWFAHLRHVRGVPGSRVRLLRDREATREEISLAVEEMASAVKPGGTLWFVFIGHGAPLVDGRDGVLLGADTQQTARSLEVRGLSRGDLLKRLGEGRQARTVVVLDACFSGQTEGGALVPGLQPLVPVKRLPNAPQGLVLLSAGGADQFAGPLPGAQRPAFSYLLLGALRGWADEDEDRRVSAQEALSYTRQAMSRTIAGRLQVPELWGDGDAALSEGLSERGPDLDAMVLRR